ncbi:ankyrin repeat-containing domain protein [Cyathus striatus]|nr:ankyrin repeat-containing domain protein [Cyathus striatus]
MSGLSIHSAAHNNQYSLVRALVTEDPKCINTPDVDGRTPLHWAATSGSIDITRYLIDQKAEVDKPDSGGWTALHIAGMYCSSVKIYLFSSYAQLARAMKM